jgi:alkanesulfonate monooxygenase SsuD/methylene tetrahydromethanopterin reductase-like flavin-dependent oxidoreductase (luciferase family)
VKFGLLYELEYARPWPAGFEREVFHQALEQIELADRVGFDYVWQVEHHFLSEYSHSSAPEVFLGAVSQRTKRIRIGHGIVLLPIAYNHPVRVAERIATLDILSDGRVEFGTGRSGTPVELDGFGINPALSKDMWYEAVRMIPRMWRDEAFSYEGRFFSVPPRNVVPKPVQKPHPPMWVAAASPDTFVRAGNAGLGVLCFLIGKPANLVSRVQSYRDAIRGAEPVGEFINEQVAGFTVTLCLDDAAEARAIGGPAALWYTAMLGTIVGDWRGRCIPGYEYYSAMAQESSDQATRDLGSLLDDGTFCIGDPADCIRTIAKYEAAGVDQILCLMQAGRIPHEKIMRSIELFGEQVIPAFRQTHDRADRKESA